MKFDEEKVAELFPKFWKKQYPSFEFFVKGTSVEPQSVNRYNNIMLTNGDFGDNYNYEVRLIDLSVRIDNYERPMEGRCYIKVIPKILDNDMEVSEEIIDIKGNRIDLYEK